jgi:hypothetical protein
MSAGPPTPTSLLHFNSAILRFSYCPHKFGYAVNLFYHFFEYVHREPHASDDRINLFWEALADKSPNLQTIQRESQINHIDAYKELATKFHLFNGLPTIVRSFSADETESRGYTRMFRGVDWLILCAWSTTPALPYQLLDWLQRMYNLQSKMSRPAYQGTLWSIEWLLSTPAYPTDPAVAVFYRNNDYAAIIHILRFVLRQAMSVADIWAHCPVDERETNSTMPSYKWYAGGLQMIGLQIMKEIESAFSEYPHRVREQLKVISWADLYCYLWDLANTASYWLVQKHTAQHNTLFPGDRLRFRMYCYILETTCLSFTAPNSPIHRLITEALGCHWQLVQTVYADSYPIVEAEYFLDLDYMGANRKTPQYLRAGLGRRFYGHRLRDEPAGRQRTNRIAGLGDHRSDSDDDDGWICGDVLRTLVKRGSSHMGRSMFFQASALMSIPGRATSV